MTRPTSKLGAPARFNPGRRRGRGFTLVELLVVIGIIAVLISILLPTLSRARASAQRTQCLSGLRQLHLALVMYANTYNGAVPLGCWSGYRQQNFMVWRLGQQQPIMFGLLWEARLMKTPQAMYCPADSHHQGQFNTPSNPWPPYPPTPTVNVRIGYGSRPIDAKGKVVDWGNGSKPYPFTVVAGKDVLNFQKLGKYRNLAILADIFAEPQRLNHRHKKGINVLYGHGGANWVEAKPILKDLNQCKDPFNHSYDVYQENIWKILDKQ
jgi:prepilin-type N-terminal cleavage/methylation domain-containing protein